MKWGDDKKHLRSFRFHLLRPRHRQRPEVLHAEDVMPTQRGWLERSIELPASKSGHRLRFEIFGGVPGTLVATAEEGNHSGCWASVVVEGESTEP